MFLKYLYDFSSKYSLLPHQKVYSQKEYEINMYGNTIKIWSI